MFGTYLRLKALVRIILKYYLLFRKADDIKKIEKAPVTAVLRRTGSTMRLSRQTSLRGETLRSSMIQRGSIRSRKTVASPVSEESPDSDNQILSSKL